VGFIVVNFVCLDWIWGIVGIFSDDGAGVWEIVVVAVFFVVEGSGLRFRFGFYFVFVFYFIYLDLWIWIWWWWLLMLMVVVVVLLDFR